MEIGTAANGLEVWGVSEVNSGVPNGTYLCLDSLVLRDVFDVPLVFNEIRWSRPKLEIDYPSPLELQPEVRVDRKETSVQPPRKHMSECEIPTAQLYILLIFQHVFPALREIATRVGTGWALHGE